jgi:hypothetical protein
LESADLFSAHLESANLFFAHLEDAYLTDAHLEDAWISFAHLERASLYRAHLQGAKLDSAFLGRTILADARLEKTEIKEVTLCDEKHVGPCLVDIHWGVTNLTRMDWSQIKILGDEYEARQKKDEDGVKDGGLRLLECKGAVRANRQLAAALQAQRLNEEAARFSYRAQILQKRVFWYEMIGFSTNMVLTHFVEDANREIEHLLALSSGSGFSGGTWVGQAGSRSAFSCQNPA